MEPRDCAERIERAPELPRGDGERFGGYGVMGAPFCSGHVLAMRRFTASSVGAGYTSVWHRDPGGAWTFYADVDPLEACTRYFVGGGSGVDGRDARAQRDGARHAGPPVEGPPRAVDDGGGRRADAGRGAPGR